MIRHVIAGQDVKARYDAMRADALRGPRDNETIPNFQIAANRLGFREAELVESNYGWSVRYASGLQNFGLLASSRARQVDGTLADAIRYAREWQKCGLNRFATVYLPDGVTP